jgi:hypothetical protein
LAAGAGYSWSEVDYYYTPRNVNQAAAGDISPDTVIVDIFGFDDNFFALDDQGQLYVWGRDYGMAGLGGLETCDYTNYTNPTDCGDNNGYWGDSSYYAPISINRIAAGDIGPTTRIQQLYGSYWDNIIYAIDDQGQLYGWGDGNFGDGQGDQNYDAPVNINQAAAGDITASTVIVDIVTNRNGKEVYVVDDDGQVYVWGSYSQYSSHPNGMGVVYVCTDSQYITQLDCETNSEWWHSVNYSNDPDRPTSINAIAAGDITSTTKIVDVEYVGRTAYAIDDQGQLYVWTDVDDDDAMTGLGKVSYCDDSDYDNQTDCETANSSWHEEEPYLTNNAPVNVNQVHAGSIGPDTVIREIFTTGEIVVFALDSEGQLHVWGDVGDGLLPIGKDYGVTYTCIPWENDYDNQVDCENNGGYWAMQQDYHVDVPVNANMIAAGDINDTTRINSVGFFMGEGPYGAYALDDNGQMYTWGSLEIQAGLGNPCSVPQYNDDQDYCEGNGGTWDASHDPERTISTPINLNQLNGSVITSPASSIVSVSSVGGEGMLVMYAVDSDGYVYAWGRYKEYFGVTPCLIEADWIDDEEYCLDEGGTWDQSKYLDQDDYSSIIINKSRTGDLGPAGYQVLFGGVASPSVTTVDAHTLKAIAPARPDGKVDVVVSDGTTISTLTQAFTFYSLFLDISVDTDVVAIGGASGLNPTISGVFGSATNTVTVATSNPKGYSLDLSTDQPDMAHQSIAGNYLSTTSNICTWDDDNKIFTNTTSALANNTYGFTLTPANISAEKLCQMPNSTTPLTVKYTTEANETGDATVIYYGAKINLEQLAGEYKTTVVYTALANP